jgi:hypothetical protein
LAVSVSAIVASLEAEYTANATQLAAMGGALDFSDQGRSINMTAARDSLTKRQREIEKTLAQLGSPIGTIEVPFVVSSRAKT